jgi:hypothetical protein
MSEYYDVGGSANTGSIPININSTRDEENYSIFNNFNTISIL